MVLNRDREVGGAESGARRRRIVLADDDYDILEGIHHLLAPEFDVVRSVTDGAALMAAVAELRPDAVVCDVNMPGLNGIEAGQQIIANGLCDAVIILTMYGDPNVVESALAVGIRGYVLKVDAGDELNAGLRKVISGGIYLSQTLVAKPSN